jgi:hypothetical protein
MQVKEKFVTIFGFSDSMLEAVQEGYYEMRRNEPAEPVEVKCKVRIEFSSPPVPRLLGMR